MVILINPSFNSSTTNYFDILMGDDNGKCPLSASAVLKINGTAYPFGSCEGASEPFTGNPSFALQAADGDDQAEIDVAGLVPGLDAKIISPVGGQVAAGELFYLSVPAVFQGQVPEYADFRNTSDVDPYAGMETYPISTTDNGQTAGITAPTHAATYDVSVRMQQIVAPNGVSDYLSANVLACTEFARCSAQAINQLGPVQVTVTP